MTKKRLFIGVCLGISALGLVLLGIVIARVFTPSNNPLPPSISETIDFSPLTISPSNTTIAAASYALSTAEDGTRLLTYVIKVDGHTITTSQYPQPPQFNDIPEYKETFLNNVIQRVSSVSTANGTIILGKMAKQQNKQLGVMLERGLIVFLMPDAPLEESQWRKVGDAFTIVKLEN